MRSPLGRFDDPIGPHFQDKLADIVRSTRPAVMVETGLWKGFGAEYYLHAMDTVGRGNLYSIDPTPHKDYDANPIVHPRFTHIRDYSHAALVDLFVKHGPFDIFLHDSDHGPGCQTFEYELGWSLLRPGGILATDDPWWGLPPHLAWSRFLERHGMTPPGNIIGNAIWVQKPESAEAPVVDFKWAQQRWHEARIIANREASRYGHPDYLLL